MGCWVTEGAVLAVKPEVTVSQKAFPAFDFLFSAKKSTEAERRKQDFWMSPSTHAEITHLI